MSYKIVVDSCCDLTEEMKGWSDFTVIPLTLQIADYVIQDDENFNQDDFIARMKANGGMAKSACPSPEAFKTAFEGDYDDVYVFTITDKLSGCYNAAVQGKMLYEEENKDNKKIHIFNSLATAGLETIAVKRVKELADAGVSFEEIVAKMEPYIVENLGLYFCLESLDALKNNGRLFALAAKLLEKIRVKLVCKRTTEGNIAHSGQDLTMSRALIKLANFVADEVKGKDLTGKKVVITHVCCEDRAKLVADKLREKTSYEDICILKGSGLNSLYASDGGIIVSYEF